MSPMLGLVFSGSAFTLKRLNIGWCKLGKLYHIREASVVLSQLFMSNRLPNIVDVGRRDKLQQEKFLLR